MAPLRTPIPAPPAHLAEGCDHCPCIEHRLHLALYEAAPTGILIVNEHGEIISHNSRFVEMWEIDLPSILGPQSLNAFGSPISAVRPALLCQIPDPQRYQTKVADMRAKHTTWSRLIVS
jgi:PAS domain-containing protein